MAKTRWGTGLYTVGIDRIVDGHLLHQVLPEGANTRGLDRALELAQQASTRPDVVEANIWHWAAPDSQDHPDARFVDGARIA